jgi:hypothetical protein
MSKHALFGEPKLLATVVPSGVFEAVAEAVCLTLLDVEEISFSPVLEDVAEEDVEEGPLFSEEVLAETLFCSCRRTTPTPLEDTSPLSSRSDSATIANRTNRRPKRMAAADI